MIDSHNTDREDDCHVSHANGHAGDAAALHDDSGGEEWSATQIDDEIPSALKAFSDAFAQQREIADLCDEIAGGDAAAAETVRVFLAKEYNPMLEREADALLPMLKKCCLPDDNFDAIAERYLTEPDGDANGATTVVSCLNDVTPVPGDKKDAAIAGFAKWLRRRASIWSAVILPIARVRLSSADLDELSDLMKKTTQQIDQGTNQ